MFFLQMYLLIPGITGTNCWRQHSKEATWSNTQTAEQILQNEQLRRENQELQKQSKGMKPTKTKQVFSVETVRDSPIKDNFRYYTGFVYLQFMSIFKFLVPNKFECPKEFPRTISSIREMRLEDQFLLTLIKLRLNVQFKHLANLFGVFPQDAGALFRQWINFIFYRFGSVPLWPERQNIQCNSQKNSEKSSLPPSSFLMEQS